MQIFRETSCMNPAMELLEDVRVGPEIRIGGMMKTLILSALLALCSAPLLGQRSHFGLYVNPDIDTADADISQVISLWRNYLNSHPDSSYDNPYWAGSEKKRYTKFDFLNTAYFNPSFYYLLPFHKTTVMSISKIDSVFVIRTLFASVTDSGFCRPFCITLVAAAREDGQYRLCNILPISTRRWQRENVGSITFIFPPSHHFNRELAQRMNDFVDSLTAMWNVKPHPTDFYLADDLSDIMRMRGFDFYAGEGYNRGTGGVADIANSIVFGAGQDEWYPHEFVHVYVNPLFPNAHNYFLEGYAALLGGSRGHEILWHMKRIEQYLEEHPELDLNDLLGFGHFDGITDPKYVFGGLLCDMALQKGGLPALKRLMSFGSHEKDFYLAIESHFGVQQQDLNKFIRAGLKEYRANHSR